MLASEIAHIDHAPVLHDEDLTLVLDAQHGSMAAFEKLVKRHERRMFRIARNLLHHREDAEDAVQEAFLKAFRKLQQFQGRSKFSTWLVRITVNQALAKLRREPVFWSSLAEDPQDEAEAGVSPHEIADWAPNPETVYTTLELRELLEKNLRRLRSKRDLYFFYMMWRDFRSKKLPRPWASACPQSKPGHAARACSFVNG